MKWTLRYDMSFFVPVPAKPDLETEAAAFAEDPWEYLEQIEHLVEEVTTAVELVERGDD